MPEKILLLSLRIHKILSRMTALPEQRARRLIELNVKREALLDALDISTSPSAADAARIEIIRLLNARIRQSIRAMI